MSDAAKLPDLWGAYQAAHRAYLASPTDAHRSELIRAYRAWCTWYDPGSAERNVAYLIGQISVREAA